MQANYSQTSFCSTYVLSTLQFTLLCIYNFVFLVIVELLSDTNAYIQRKSLKIASKTDSPKQGKVGAKQSGKKKKKQRTIFVLMQTALFLGVQGQQRVVRA